MNGPRPAKRPCKEWANIRENRWFMGINPVQDCEYDNPLESLDIHKMVQDNEQSALWHGMCLQKYRHNPLILLGK